jgi:hypothetical protein
MACRPEPKGAIGEEFGLIVADRAPMGKSGRYPGRLVRCKMGEKGNLFDSGEEIFANLAEQGPQFWIEYEQYRLARGKHAEERVIAEGAPQDPAAEQSRNQSTA